MSEKKRLILETAKTLFNEKGYNNVTIRMIALTMNMSSGNLNYHFKKREDIFEALYFEMVFEFDERIKRLPTTEVSVAQIKTDIEQSMRRMIDYKFFWTDLYNILTVSDKVKNHFQEVYKKRIAGCFLLFAKMKKEKIMRGSSFELEYNFLAERMINHGNTWLYSSGLYLNAFTENKIDNHVNLLLSMLYPYFTSKGKTQFKNLVPEFFTKKN